MTENRTRMADLTEQKERIETEFRREKYGLNDDQLEAVADYITDERTFTRTYGGGIIGLDNNFDDKTLKNELREIQVNMKDHNTKLIGVYALVVILFGINVIQAIV